MTDAGSVGLWITNDPGLSASSFVFTLSLIVWRLSCSVTSK